MIAFEPETLESQRLIRLEPSF